MDKSLSTLDWSHIQSFCSVAKHGSLSGAARSSGQSQPTLSRHIKSIETSLNIELFRRAPRGLVLTDSGMELLPLAHEMQEAAARLQLSAAAQSDDLRGTVRITASVVFAHFILPEILTDIRQRFPEIHIELVPSDTTENLIFREADIAIRMYRPQQLDVIARHVKDQPMAIYGARNYLDRVGRPKKLQDLMALDFLGFDKSDLIIRAMREIGMDVGRDFFPIRCDDQAAHWQMVCAGAGIGGMQTIIGDKEPRVERISTEIQLPTLPVWLAAPEALRSNPSIRAIWDFLTNALLSQPDA